MNLFDKFRRGLERTRQLTVKKLTGLLGLGKLDENSLAEIEEILLEADVGVSAADQLIQSLKTYSENVERGSSPQPLEAVLATELIRMLNGKGEKKPRFTSKPWVILLVGVNGSGKTTTAGKLAHLFSQQGKTCVIAAADTFRAAAVEQVEVWSDRAGARLVKQTSGADPSAVAFDAYKSTVARGEDVLIIDTAGRLQAKQNLMEELAKLRRVLGRLDPTAPHEVLLVIDSTTGQNGLSQARGFGASAGVTGLVITKLDGSARGGIVIPIRRELDLAVEFIGLGEGIDDLQPFDSEAYVNALISK